MELIVSAVASAVLGLALGELYHWLVPSSETRQIIESGQTVRNRLDATAELSAEIENLNVVLVFRSPLNAGVAGIGRAVLFRVTKQSGSRYTHLEVIGDFERAANADGQPVWAFLFRAASIIGDFQTRRGIANYGQVTYSSSLLELPLPLSIRTSRAIPFSRIRDLNGCNLQIFLAASLADATQRIDLVANSSFGFQRRLRLLSRAVAKGDWREVDVEVQENVGKNVEGKKMWALTEEGGSAGRWSVELDRAEWETHRSLLPETLRVPYQ